MISHRVAQCLKFVSVDLLAQIAELKRELKMRERVYPQLIARGKLDEHEARNQYRALLAALKTLEGLNQGALI